MINTAVERTYPLAKAARKYASSRGEGSVHPGTLHRWRVAGIGGITLECIKVGGVWHTSQESLQRFFEQLTSAQESHGAAEPHSAGRSPKIKQTGHHDRRDEQVEAELDAMFGGGPNHSTLARDRAPGDPTPNKV